MAKLSARGRTVVAEYESTPTGRYVYRVMSDGKVLRNIRVDGRLFGVWKITAFTTTMLAQAVVDGKFRQVTSKIGG